MFKAILLSSYCRRKKILLYDDKGILIDDGRDLCDCLSESCEGCFFACPECESEKCGVTCRVKRR